MGSPSWHRALKECRSRLVKGRTIAVEGENRVVEGECDYENQLLSVNREIPLDRRLSALLHECLHWVHPDRDEAWVLRREQMEWERLKPSSLRVLLDALYPKRGE